MGNSFIKKNTICINSVHSLEPPLPLPTVQVSPYPSPKKVSTTPKTLLSHTSSTSSRTSKSQRLLSMEVSLRTSLLLFHNHQSTTSPSTSTTPPTEPSSLLMELQLTWPVISLTPTGSQSLDLLMLKSTRWASIWKLMFLNKNLLRARMHQNLRFKNLPLPSTQMISISPFQDPSLPRLLPSSSQCSNPPSSHLLLSKFKLKSEPWLTQPSTKTSSSTEVRKLSHILLESPVTTLNMVLVPQ